MARIRLAYLVTHPIQYQAPLLRRVAADPDIDLHVFFGSDFSVKRHVDGGFGQVIEWDVPLLDGYAHSFLPLRGWALPAGRDPSFRRPWNGGLAAELRRDRFDALWVHGYHRLSHLEAMAIARARGIKVLIRDEVTAISAGRSLAKRLLKAVLLRAMDRLVDAYLTIGTLNRAFWGGYGVADQRLFMMPYAVDNAWFQARDRDARAGLDAARAELGLAPGRPVVLFVGKLIARKRPLDLLDAYRRVAGAATRHPFLLFAGSGPLEGELAQRVAEAGLADVRLLGFRNQAELARLYALADLFVLPSEREAWGLVVNEAMNAGCAVIVSDRVGAAPDLVRPGVNGFNYPVGDTAALARCLESCLADPDRLAAMGQASRTMIDRWGFDADLAGLKAALAATVGR
jgi:glycosyltransferase involved in cell wall biosynthesis